uniref:(northern house mosquito) hypothetical protein n=1 Tax=Culex pipiens TaxID=7175 RepID=A0A8D8FKM4_CULPI
MGSSRGVPTKLPCDVSSRASLSCCRFGSLPQRRRWQRCNRRRTASAIRSFTTALRVRSSRPKPTTSCPTLTRSVRFSVASRIWGRPGSTRPNRRRRSCRRWPR